MIMEAINLNFEEFKKLTKDFNVIPLFVKIASQKNSNEETPITAFLKLRTKNSYLLESAEKDNVFSRYSFIGIDPKKIIKNEKNIFNNIQKQLDGIKTANVPGLPPFHGGLVGYLAYESITDIEKVPLAKNKPFSVPRSSFMQTETCVAFDHKENQIYVICNVYLSPFSSLKSSYEKGLKKIKEITKKLEAPAPVLKKLEIKNSFNPMLIKSNQTKSQYTEMVNRSKEFIKAGDIFQVVLSQRFEMELKDEPFELYRKLRQSNPAPYMFFLQFESHTLIGTSPEILVRSQNGIATLRPIAGTRPRGKTNEEDLKLEKELLADQKELSEHLMLVDLGRNDLGRVCETGSVKPTDLNYVERYSQVMHIVSNLEGKLQKDKTPVDLMKSCFPAGTVSGAPKIRAMEIISELEPDQRGPYAGSVCYFDFGGNMDSCITLRTMTVIKNRVYIQAGAGIVADSDPIKEYEETFHKASALIKVCL
jgi:anthranilate synthase component 1